MSSKLRWLFGFFALALLAPEARAQLTPEERKMCVDVCYKQLRCAGAPTDMNALGACSGACEQAIAMRNPAMAKPWRAAAACDARPCGDVYNQCIVNAMSAPSASEKQCATICAHRLQCNGQAADVGARQSCEASCVGAMESAGSSAAAFEQASLACVKQKCGLDTEACVAKRLGGLNAECAEVCESRGRCAKAAGRDVFLACMPQCLAGQRDPNQKRALDAERGCKGCGEKREECIAKGLGGHHMFCRRVCFKQMSCAGVTDPGPIGQCQGACIQVMTAGDPRMTDGFQAIDKCTGKACGDAFNGCVSAAMGQIAAAPVQPVQPVQPVNPVQPRADPARARCETVCAKLDSCTPGSGGQACIDRCLFDTGAREEMDAILGCTKKACGAKLDACVLASLDVVKKDLGCVPGCRKDISCRMASSPGYAMLAACARSCKEYRKTLVAAAECAAAICGEPYMQCLASKSAPPVVAKVEPVRPIEPVKPVDVVKPVEPVKPAKPDPKVVRCEAICEKAASCASYAGGAECVERCVNDKFAAKEFKLREGCAKRSCDDYEGCLFAGLKVPKGQLACVPVCRHDLACKRQGGAADTFAVASCAKACKRSSHEIVAVTACAEAGCGTAFDICVSSKVKLATAPKVEEPKVDKDAQRCQAICDRAALCNPAAGGDHCVSRCLAGKDAAEYKAREECKSEECDAYDACLVGRLGAPKAKLACLDACKQEVSCRPPGEPHDLNAIVDCVKSCAWDKKELDAIAACQLKGCGPAFKACVLEKSGKIADVQKVEKDCQDLCDKADVCLKGSGGVSCMARCEKSKGGSAEFKARKKCGGQLCDTYDGCLLDEMAIKPPQRRCLESCRFDLGCERGNRMGDLDGLKACLEGCKSTDDELSVRSDCYGEGCGTRFTSCIKRRTDELAKARAVPVEPTVSPAVKRCNELCAQAESNESGTGGEACAKRCVEDKASAPEFAARDKCKDRIGTAYGLCVLTGMGVSKDDLRCVMKCRKDLTCKGTADLASVVGCAKACKSVPPKESDAATMCAAQACGEPYRKCVADLLSPAMSPEQQRCTDLCDQSERCSAGMGGAACVKRCLDTSDDSKLEFNARGKCMKKLCKDYNDCVAQALVAGDEEPAPPSKPPEKPGTKPDVVKPEAPKPEAPKANGPKPESAKPEAPKPEVAKPEAPKPEAPKPDAGKPAAPGDAPKPQEAPAAPPAKPADPAPTK